MKPGEELPAHFVRSLCLFEAVSSHHACLGCKVRGSLRWNSSLRTDFCHLVCEECRSVYTLRSVANSEKVHKLFRKRTHFGGSYAHFHEVKHHIETQDSNGLDSKMFIIFATRSTVGEGSRELPVYAAEIK
eukprot:CCRYP_014681-RA/>CCRYP_014681-RA protein AED:0.37 eAED:0.36 QI:0/-1/0/1/-1/1/1/0/130